MIRHRATFDEIMAELETIAEPCEGGTMYTVEQMCNLFAGFATAIVGSLYAGEIPELTGQGPRGLHLQSTSYNGSTQSPEFYPAARNGASPI